MSAYNMICRVCNKVKSNPSPGCSGTGIVHKQPALEEKPPLVTRVVKDVPRVTPPAPVKPPKKTRAAKKSAAKVAAPANHSIGVGSVTGPTDHKPNPKAKTKKA